VNRQEAQQLVAALTAAWVADPDSAAVWSGTHEDRLGLRMTQTSRDFTTVWFDVGDLTVASEAYLLPAPNGGHQEVYRQALLRNDRSWPVYIAMDATGGLYVRGRVPLTDLTSDRLEELVGATYELVDLAFPGLVAAGFERREKTP
jgi:hypothetical protein